MPREDAAQFNGTLKTATYPNKYNAVIPAEGPFYRIGLKLTVKDATAPNGKRTLIEGLDYFLGYYFKELTDAEQDRIYGGFILLNATEVDYEILSVGRQFRIPQSEIGKYLVRTDLKDPRNTDWSELMKYAPVISPIDPPANLPEAILRDEVVKALEDIRLGILARASELDTAFTEVTNLIYENGNQIFEDQMYQHHLITNAHGYTTTDISALPVLGKAVDATKAFGRTLAELVNLMSTTGIQQKHVDMLLDNTLGDLLGRLRVLSNGALTFQTTAGHLISVKGEQFIITSPKPLVLKADQDNNDPGIGVEFASGLNTLWVHSGTPANVLAPVYNSVYLVTPEMVSMYLTSVTLLPANAYFKSSDTLKIYGTGKETNRVYMNVDLPTATTGVAGLFSITNLSADVSTGAAISQKAVTDLKGKLDLYVDDTYTINGKGFVKGSDGKQVLTLTKTDLGVEKMDNTTPANKPVTKALTAVLANKSKSTHTHTIADLDNVPYGSTTASGLVKLWNIIDTTDDKMVTSQRGFVLQQRIDEVDNKMDTLLPSWAVGGAQYGNPSFLPIPTVSNYAGFGFNRAEPWGAARYEGGNVYLLRNGTDGPTETRRVYYWYAPVGGTNTFLKTYPTTFPYHPEGMIKFPGITLTQVLIAGDDAGVFEGSDGGRYLVLFNGTMNYALHSEVYRITFPDIPITSTSSILTFNANRAYATVTVSKTRVVVMVTNVAATNFYVGGWTISLSELKGKSDVDLKVAPLKHPNADGGIVRICENGGPAENDPTTKFFAYVTPEAKAKWTRSRNPVNFRPSIYSAANINVVRVRAEMHGYFADDKGATWTEGYSAVYNINTETWELTLETPIFPIAITENKIEFLTAPAMGSVCQRNHGTAWVNALFCSGGFLLNSCASVYNNEAPRISIGLMRDNTFYDLLGGDTRIAETAITFANGAVGSVYQQYMRGGIHLGGTANMMAFRWLNNGNGSILMKYDQNTRYFEGTNGWGPDNNRTGLVQAEYVSLSVTPNIWKDGQLYLNGRKIYGPGTYPYKTITGTSKFTADTITVSPETWTAVESAVSAVFAYWTDPLTIDVQLSLYMFDIGGYNAAFVVASTRTWENDTLVRAYCRTCVWKVPMTVNNGNVQLGMGNMDVVVPEWRDGEASVVLTKDQHVNSKMIQRDDGFVIQLGCFYRQHVVGDSRHRSFLLTCDENYANWTSSITTVNPGVGESDIIVMPETGYIGVTKWMYVGLYYAADVYQNTLRNFKTGTPVENILAGVKTAEGWELYITEEELLRFGSAYYTLPLYNSDIRDLYPTNYRNRTLYMHATLVSGVPTYQLLETRLPDTDTRLYIGKVVTDNDRITYSDFDKAKRLGRVKQLEEHTSVAYRHDVSVAREMKLGSLGMMYKESMITPVNSGATHGYADSQKLADAISHQKRYSLPIQKRFKGFAATKWEFYENVADRFWVKNPTESVVLAAENSKAAGYNMKWVGDQSVPYIAGATYTAVARLKLTVPGAVGDPVRRLNLRFAVPNGVKTLFYSMNSPGSQQTATSFASGDNLVAELGGWGAPAGSAVVIQLSATVTAASYQSLKNKFLAIQVIDVTTGTVIRQTDVDTPFMIYVSSDPAPGVVTKARELVFNNLPSEPVVVLNAGNDGINPPYQSTFTSNTLTLTVGTGFVADTGPVDLDVLQVNLMFKS